jgi:LysR family transcriptional regulator, transcriptional activator of nhaA
VRRAFRFPQDLQDRPLLVPGPGSEIRTLFDQFCEQQGFRPNIRAEVDDMAMLRLLARDSNALALMPVVVVRDEIVSRRLEEHWRVPDVQETFYAITGASGFQPAALKALLARSESEVLGDAPRRGSRRRNPNQRGQSERAARD